MCEGRNSFEHEVVDAFFKVTSTFAEFLRGTAFFCVFFFIFDIVYGGKAYINTQYPKVCDSRPNFTINTVTRVI